MEVVSTRIDNIIIEGYRGEYILETIEKTGSFYESTILNKWSPILHNSKVVFDVGSNIGNHAIYWATHLKPLTIYAFEPYPDNFSRLQNNVIKNNLNTIITPIQKGVGDHLGYATINNFDESNLGSTSFIYTKDKQNSTIQIIDLDSFVGESNLKIVDFVKIDTEGFELLVLQGMQEIINTHHPDIWVEVSYSTYLEVINTLKKDGYILHDIEQFNLLFLHPTRHSSVEKIESNKVLDEFFKYLEKTNQYYKAYNTSKKWLNERNRTLDQLKSIHQKQIQDLKSEYDKQLKECHKQYSKEYREKTEEFDRELDKVKDLQNELAKALFEDTKLFDNQIDTLENIKQFTRKLQTQNSYLKTENQEYRRKFEKITGTWYGRFLLKCYKMLKKVKKRLRLS